MVRKTVALSIDGLVYDKYQDYCKANCLILSRKIEEFMRKELSENGC
ncbi:MAG: hypothetical protein JW727_01560 [Candidatus Aenigmarchaeota archaeon]|nr:hypothetical protein [Candidatus Aenigmarchaeota archaeon]